MSIVTKSGVVVSTSGCSILCSDGAMFSWISNTLYGRGASISDNVMTMQEAVEIIVFKYGGI